ncbi:phosphoribosyltransferase family protein [Actinomadura craniellae]|uniref:phosphoribosyltransferase family protein n=1 Tax=Actinomadura craniellae TaxID=2231787 RepID=UPI0018F203C8|nr:phosphoribosyltransferase family protein [Actinomadura craniellae]
MTERTWPGEWVSARLGVTLHDGGHDGHGGDRASGTGLADLVGLAVRRNPRRAHLLVSAVLGKHVPTDPRLVYGAGLLLGELVHATLTGRPARRDHPLGSALAGRPGSAAALRDRSRGPRPPVDALVIGYAETATALGHSVADALGAAWYLHSTRRPAWGIRPYGAFEEEHSHATSHLLLPAPAGPLHSDAPLVLVDDELSTGTTVLNTLAALHAARPRRHYVVAALVDLRGPADRDRLAALATRLDARIDTVALATGRVGLPAGILAAGRALAESLTDPAARPPEPGRNRVTRVEIGWPDGLPDGGRHGFTPEHRAALEKELPAQAARLAAELPAAARRVLVLGFEELMYVPLRLAEALADALPRAAVRYSTTTRSPVLAVDDPGYAIRTRLAFPAHDDPADGPGTRYAYNVAPGADPARAFDAIVLVVDGPADTPALAGGLLPLLAGQAPVLLVTIPAYRPGRREVR